jgi:hypothetical protein
MAVTGVEKGGGEAEQAPEIGVPAPEVAIEVDVGGDTGTSGDRQERASVMMLDSPEMWQTSDVNMAM